MVASPIKKAVFHLLRGNIKTVGQGVVGKIRTQIPDTVEFITEEKTPEWVSSSDKQQIYRLTQSDYMAVIEGDQIGISQLEDRESTIEAVELPIVSVGRSNTLKIQYNNDNTGEIINETEIQIDQSYEYPPVVWKPSGKLDCDSDITARFDIERNDKPGFFSRGFSKLSQSSEVPPSTKIGTPAIVPTGHQPPIILISIDTLQYDRMDELSSLIEELGQDAIIPTEPRTQGTWTPPSHASMLSGTHPGNHGYVGWGKTGGDKRPINPAYTTIPELLTNYGYKCSGLVSHSRILPEFGFGRGFHRFRHDGMTYADWITRENDVKSGVSTLMDWMERDATVRDHSLFYFFHVFDPHFPYVPPIERLPSDEINLARPKEYRTAFQNAKGDDWTYLDGYSSDYDIDADLIDEMREWYSKSITYTAEQTAHLLRYLKDIDLFDDSLIIITGDHGEEFGERGFFAHTSLYDTNIRPFMAVKPPAGEDWPDREEIDTIDFLPTIAELVGSEIPDQCDGRPIQSGTDGGPRITERIYPDSYNVAVEIDGVKGIFTYESNYPDRPGQVIIESEPELTEYYRLSGIRSNQFDEADPGPVLKERLHEVAVEFVLDGETYSGTTTASKPSQETVEQLQDLGYR